MKRNKHEIWVTLDPYSTELRDSLDYFDFYRQKYGGPEHIIKPHGYPLHIFFDRTIVNERLNADVSRIRGRKSIARVKIPVCVFDGELRRPLGIGKAYDGPEILHEWKMERHIDRLRRFGVPVFLISDYSQECLNIVCEELGQPLVEVSFYD